MLIIPAIDLKDAQVVRYTKGRLNKKVYSDNPVAVALGWQAQGAKFLHVVDLDGAFTGKQKNLGVIKKIIKALSIPVEVSGGIRDLETLKKIIALGAKRVVLGTRAIEDLSFLKMTIETFGAKVALAVDASGGKLGLHGWKKSAKLKLKDLLKDLKKIHLKTVIFTDITRDGTLKGINLTAIKELLESVDREVIVSGGVSSLEDISKLVGLSEPNLKGVIIGKALYENKFSLKEAIAVSREKC